MELIKDSKKLVDIYDACLANRPAGVDLADMDSWRGTLLELNQIVVKKGDNYNFMKSIINSYNLFMEAIPVIKNSYDDLDLFEKQEFITRITTDYEVIYERLQKLKFNLSFYKKFGFFDNHVVAVGANGSGKTSLADNLRENLNNNGLVISAQRVLFIPELDKIPMAETSAERWSAMNLKSRTFKNIEDFLEIKEEFGFVMENLIAKHYSYAIHRLDETVPEKRLTTELESTLEIWNSVFDHRKLKLVQGIKLMVFQGVESYEPIKLSEGEKSALYLISQVIQAPKKGFIIIDEPEMYLHKTIISKIWDKLEHHRQDCTFIYLTHDLDFAESRHSAAKVWLKSFTYPNVWEINSIPKNNIPQKLMLELLGSRKNILFCEGRKGSIDENIYRALLPDFTIMPVEGCLNVINFTKAYNKIPHLNTKAYGLIDSDHHTSQRLQGLKEHFIFNIKLAEVENLFLDEKLLELVSLRLYKDRVAQIKEDVIKELEKEKQLQTSRFVTNKINNIFNDSHVEKANSKEQIELNLSVFNSKIDIDSWHSERLDYIENIIREKNYAEAISIFNNKGLLGIVERNFGIKGYTDFVLKLILEKPEALTLVKALLPAELVTLA